MATGTALILIAGMAIVTYLTRLPLYFLTLRRHRLSPLVGHILGCIPAAAFAAIVFPGVVAPGGHTELRSTNLYMYAALVTIAAAVLMRRNLLGTILVGIASAALLRQFFG